MDREEAIRRLRSWAAHANHEAEMALTQENILNWQGQAQVLNGVATYLTGQGASADDDTVWRQIVADRTGVLAAWDTAREGPEAMLYAGMVAGFDVALTTLTDIAGRDWALPARAKRWVNR
ncbi:MAG TPA: hypothetical protein VF116_00320 [Ktedonobacterales bacterium]